MHNVAVWISSRQASAEGGEMKRSSGILLHITSLPSEYGIGSVGKEAVRFLDWMQRGRQSVWQILPLTQPDCVNSPYASSSAFAGNEMLIDIEGLAEAGYIETAELPETGGETDKTDYVKARAIKEPLFRKAYEAFLSGGGEAEAEAFYAENSYWLEDFALYTVLKEDYSAPWYEWPKEYKRRHKQALSGYVKENERRIGYVKFLQYVFYSQWRKLREEAVRRGISIMGDIPMYVSYDSADVWAHPTAFLLTGEMKPKKVAGVPPDYFSEDGQLWGNPIYNWKNLRKNGYEWWMERIRHCGRIYDYLRIDHFRAFEAYWQVDAKEETAKHGEWIKGEGIEFIEKLKKAVPEMAIIAEDLGERTEGLTELMEKSGLPGMKVLEFAFDGNPDNAYLPHNYERNCVAYIGTHDNDTLVGWWSGLSEGERDMVHNYTGIENEYEINRKVMKLLSRSVADVVIFTMQDVLGMKDGRMNTPGIGDGSNWLFSIRSEDLREDDAKFLADLSRLYSR